MYYRHPDRPSALVKKILALLETSLSDDEQMLGDRDQVKRILCIEKKDLCRTQTQKGRGNDG